MDSHPGTALEPPGPSSLETSRASCPETPRDSSRRAAPTASPAPPGWLAADWPAPPGVHAGTSTRRGGCSPPPWDSLNLAGHVGDAPARVAHNRARLQAHLGLPSAPWWLSQHHGVRVADWGEADRRADGAYTDRPGAVLAVLTGDCLPVLLCERHGRELALLHAGWRGLAAGILDRGLARMRAPPGELLAWLGPAIGPAAFEIDTPVRTAFVSRDATLAGCFRPTRPGHWQADLAAIARALLKKRGLNRVYGASPCTYTQPARFYSHRRQPGSGRMATLAWLAP